MKEIKLPSAGAVSVRIVAGHNNALSYRVALWDPKKRKYLNVGEGLASYEDPTPDEFSLGSPDFLRGKTIVMRAYVFPYPPKTPPFHAEIVVAVDGEDMDVELEQDYDDDASIASLAGVFA